MKERFVIAVLALLLIPLLSWVKDAEHKAVSHPPQSSTVTTYEHHVLEFRPQWKIPVEKPAKPEHKVTATSIEEPKHNYTDDDLYWLSRIVSAEARDEPIEGQIAVANVVLNRVASDEFPDTIKGVIFDRGQFSPVRNGTLYDKPTKDAIESAKAALEGKKVIKDNVYYFFNPKIAKVKWNFTRKAAKTIGGHRFTY